VAACSYYDSSLLAPINSGESAGDGGDGGEGGAGTSGSFLGAGGAAGEVSGTGGIGGAGAAGEVPPGTQTQLVGCAAKPIGPPKNKPTKVDGVSFVLALREVDFGETKLNGEFLYKKYGFDLDFFCSCPDDYTCKGLDSDLSRYCDGPEGRDNAGGALVAAFATLLPDFGSKSLNDSFSKGNSTLLLQVDGYNGEVDDDQVEVSWLLGEDLDSIGKPQWNGEDVWPVQKISYLENGAPPLRPKSTDKNAYVRGYVLVATLPDGTLGSHSFSIALTAPVLVGTLVPPGGGQPYWHIEDGTRSWRWRRWCWSGEGSPTGISRTAPWRRAGGFRISWGSSAGSTIR
jgi:hypothetical protein